MRIALFATAASMTVCLMAGAAFADSAAPAPAAPAAKVTPAPVVRSARSIECSKQADAQGLHGKKRKKFEADCKKNAPK
jgi:hypothetical protein